MSSKKKKHLSFLGPENNNTISISPTLPVDTEDLISSMKTIKASGPKSIPTKILKLFKKEISKPLSYIINLSFNQGIFPNLLKISECYPYFIKKPTSLIIITADLFLFYPILVKFMNNLCTCLTNFLEINKPFFSHKFGFHNGYCMNHALTTLNEMIRKALDEGRFFCGVFTDLQKIFDTAGLQISISHRTMINRTGC